MLHESDRTPSSFGQAPKGASPVATAYDAWSASYDDAPNPTRDLDAEVMLAQTFELDGKAVVEIGCGTGKNTIWLAERARFVVAIDFSERMLERARRRVISDRVRFVRQDLLDPWPVPDAWVVLVTCNLVLEHVADLARVFREARRVLRPEGRLFLSELHPFQQLLGKQARYADAATGVEVRVPAIRHDISDFVNGGIEAGLRLASIGEWRDSNVEASAPPRLLTVTFVRP